MPVFVDSTFLASSLCRNISSSLFLSSWFKFLKLLNIASIVSLLVCYSSVWKGLRAATCCSSFCSACSNGFEFFLVLSTSLKFWPLTCSFESWGYPGFRTSGFVIGGLLLVAFRLTPTSFCCPFVVKLRFDDFPVAGLPRAAGSFFNPPFVFKTFALPLS